MADRPFKSLFEARDTLNAEILAGKLQLSGPASAVFRLLVEHVLYTADDENDVGFVVTSVPGTKDPATNKGKPMGVESIARLTGLGQTAVKTALKSLEEDKLISRFTRPRVAGGRKVNRIRVNWVLPDRRVATDPTEEPRGDSSEGTPGDSSEQPGGGSSIRQEPLPLQKQKQEPSSKPGSARDDGWRGGPSAESQSQTPNPSMVSPPGSLVPVSDLDVIDGVVVSGSPGVLDWDDLGVRQHLADALGMDPGQIWDHAWTRLKRMHLGPEHAAAIDAAARRSAGARNPVAPFWGHLDDCLARAEEFRAEREAVQREAQRLADEQREEQREADEKREQQRLKREQAKAKAEKDAKDREERDAQQRERIAALADRIEEYLAGHQGRQEEEIAQDLGVHTHDVCKALYDREGKRFRSWHGTVYCLASQWERVYAEQDAALQAREAAAKASAAEALEQEIRHVVRQAGEILDVVLKSEVRTDFNLGPNAWNTALDRVLESGDVVVSEDIGGYLRLKWTGSAEA